MATSADRRISTAFGNDARLSWVLAGMAGLIGAATFIHTAGYFVTFMTGNTERAVLGYFGGDTGMAIASASLVVFFLAGVVIASLCRRYWWSRHPHNVTVLTTGCLGLAAAIDLATTGLSDEDVALGPILLVAFGLGALNTSFVENGEVAVPLSYVTGTVVKLAQGIERHISGGSIADWLGYLLLYTAFVGGATIGGFLGAVLGGPAMLVAATIVCAATTLYTCRHSEKYGSSGGA